jgi:hypothetical protein
VTTTPEELPDLPDFCWPADVSCVPDWDGWEVEPEPEADPPVAGVPLYTDGQKARAISLAGQSLRLLTAFRVGGCPITVRPAAQHCRDQTWRTYPVSGLGSTPWQPVDLGGTWLNVGCGHSGGCGCLGLREVRLYGAASSITEVKVDGAVLDPSAYRLDPGGRLVRLDGEAWPLCQNLAAPDTEAGTWSVTYTPGVAVDGLGAVAAGVLAGEFVKACAGSDDCRLPSTATQIVRQGVTITLGVGAFPGGRTGIQEVDAYLERWNPNGLTSAPMVWSPDLARPRRVGAAGTGPGVIDGGGSAPGGNYYDGGSA